MAQKNTLEIVVKATTDQAQSAFKKLDASISTAAGGVKKSLLNFSTATQGINKGFESITGISVGAVASLAGIGMAVNKVKDFMVDSVSTTAEYGRAVFEMSQKIGTSAEETSRLIQVADDFKISIGEMSGAMRIALRNGFQPSIENLAQLSDRIKGINDPTQRAAELTKIFGRNWESLLPMLLAGGDAIRSNAAAISDSLIMTEENVKATEEYRLAVDALNDAWEGTKLQVGKAVIPALTDVLTVLTDGASEAEIFKKVWEDVFDLFSGESSITTARVVKGLREAIEGGFVTDTSSLADIAKKLNEIKDPAQLAAEATKIFGKNWVDVMPILEKGSGYLNALAGSIGEIPPDMNEMIRQSAALTPELEDMGDTAEDTAMSVEELAKATAESAQAFSDLAISLKGATEAQAAKEALDLLKQALDEGRITGEQFIEMSGEIGLSFGLMDQASIALTENLRQFNEVVAQIPESQVDEFLAALYQDAQDGVSSFNQLYESMFGVSAATQTLTNDTATAAISMEEMGLAAARRYNDMINLGSSMRTAGQDAVNAKKPVDALQKAIDKLKSKSISITVNLRGNTQLGQLLQNPNFRQHGGPVSPGQTYVVGEAGPELFMPRQPGLIIPNSQTPLPFTPGAKTTGGATTTSNVTISNSFPIQRANDQWDMRDLARLVAAEIARNPQLR